METVKILSLICCLSICLICQAQRNDLLLTNSQSVDENLYEGIEGSPFYFDQWQKGKVFPNKETEAIEEVWLNYNGYTKSFEVKKDNRYIALDENWYNRVEVPKGEETIIFETGLLPKRAKQFVQLIYRGTGFYVLQDFQVSLIKTEKKRYAGDIEVQEFAQKTSYYFVENGKASLFKLKKKNVLILFQTHKSAMEKYVKKHRLKLNKTTDLVQIMAYYDELSKPATPVNTGE